jgi:hypothetical protein
MELATLIITLLKDIAWPVAILVIALVFRQPIVSSLGTLFRGGEQKGRNIRFKLGSFELESQVVAKVQERIQTIAEEPNLQKRLQLAKEPFLVDEALKAVDAQMLEALNKIHSSTMPNAFIINWNEPIHGFDPDIYQKLWNLGLIMGPGWWAEGDGVAWITPTGIALLNRVRQTTDSKSQTTT